MNLNELFQKQGLGGISKDGAVNTALYARPHIIDEQTMAWGMTNGRTCRYYREPAGLITEARPLI